MPQSIHFETIYIYIHIGISNIHHAIIAVVVGGQSSNSSAENCEGSLFCRRHDSASARSVWHDEFARTEREIERERGRERRRERDLPFWTRVKDHKTREYGEVNRRYKRTEVYIGSLSPISLSLSLSLWWYIYIIYGRRNNTIN